MACSEAQIAAVARYNKKKYDSIGIFVPKGEREILKRIAASRGKSINGLFNDLARTVIEEYARDNPSLLLDEKGEDAG